MSSKETLKVNVISRQCTARGYKKDGKNFAGFLWGEENKKKQNK